MDQLLGWGTAGGLGMLLAGLGVFFWGLQFMRGKDWQHRRWTKEEESKKLRRLPLPRSDVLALSYPKG